MKKRMSPRTVKGSNRAGLKLEVIAVDQGDVSLRLEILEGRRLLAVYSVTTSNLTGEGSLLEAVEMANTNDGEDTIKFNPGLRIDLTTEDSAAQEGVVRLTESVIIEGNGSTVFSRPTWIDTSGQVNEDSSADNPGTILVSQAMRFLKIGIDNEDNSQIEVTVHDLKAEELNNFAIVERNASLTVDNVTMSGFRAQSRRSTKRSSPRTAMNPI